MICVPSARCGRKICPVCNPSKAVSLKATAPNVLVPPEMKVRCPHRGAKLAGEPCGSPLVNCTHFGDVASVTKPCSGAARCCIGCPEHPVNKVAESPPAKDPAKVGVAVGVFRWPELADLQIRVIRESCGPVPVLISNDEPEAHAKLQAICAKHEGVTLDTNLRRIGHTGGDISVFRKAVEWGGVNNLSVVAKLSQRFLVTRPNWLHDEAKGLLASGLPLACLPATGAEPFDLRTEAALLDVAKWDTPAVLARLAPRQYWRDEPKGLPAETVILRVVKDLLGGVYWPWRSMLGTNRYARDFADVLWHCNTPLDDYRDLAAKHGVVLPKSMHCAGWEVELAEGKYLFG